MSKYERIFEELKQSVGEWDPTDSSSEKPSLPYDGPSPFESLQPDGYSIKKLDPKKLTEQRHFAENAVSDKEMIRLGAAIQKYGIEALAFYKSFRFKDHEPFKGKWGIFFLEEGIQFVGELISYYVNNGNRFDELAYKFLRAHEEYHFKIDALASTIESPMAKHLYLPLRAVYKNHASSCVEEALANAQAWSWANNNESEFGGLLEFATEFMDAQPNAYARYTEDALELSAELADNLVNQNYGKNARSRSLAIWASDSTSTFSGRGSEYLVSGIDISNLFSKVLNIPVIKDIQDTMIILDNQILKTKWEQTKAKLLKCPALRGLNFKPWPKIPGTWSVRIDRGYRAHLRPVNEANGIWKVVKIGSHDQMGH